MPVKSKQQLKFMAGVASGSIKKPGLSRSTAKEFVDATQTTKGLPRKVRKK
jgi:hypothetical protein